MELREKLEKIAAIEEANGFIGVRFSLRDSAKDAILSAEDLADHVLETLEDSVNFLARRKNLEPVKPYGLEPQ